MSEVEVLLTLDERRNAIFASLEATVEDIGNHLIAAKRDHPGSFTSWVAEHLPFSMDKAYKFMAIARALDGATPEQRAALPKAWTVMFELARLPEDRLARAIESGEVTPDITGEEAKALRTAEQDRLRQIRFGTTEPNQPPPRKPGARKPGPAPGFDPTTRLEADSLARELVRSPRANLTPPVEALLREWLGPQGDPDGPVDEQGELPGA